MTATARPIPVAESVEDAKRMFWESMEGEDYIDNFRAGFADDSAAMAAYEKALDSGCCGFADKRYLVEGRVYQIGCNYGH